MTQDTTREGDIMRGIYVTEVNNNKVTGFYLSFKHGRWTVHGFTRCTLAAVVADAGRVIHGPAIYYVNAQQGGGVTMKQRN
jgi:hypothetical protein